MTNFELISKLNNLKSISPDEDWLAGNRELLLSQVSNSGAEKLSAWQVILINTSSVLKSATRPAYALGAFVLMLLTGSFFSNQVLAGTKPNDSLYIARIISERVKVNTTFNSVQRNKMELGYALSHAREISAVLADPEFNNEANHDQVAKLNNSFNEEVDTVQKTISRLGGDVAVSRSDDVVIADSFKDDQGIQIADNADNNDAEVSIIPAAKDVEPVPAAVTLTLKASSSELAATSTEIVTPLNMSNILDEAKQFMESKDYEKASDRLKEVSENIK